jgi:hypothetical protein
MIRKQNMMYNEDALTSNFSKLNLRPEGKDMAFNYYFGSGGDKGDEYVEKQKLPEYVNVNVNNYNYNYINSNVEYFNSDNQFGIQKPINMNKKNFDNMGYIMNTQVNPQPIARYFVIKSVDEDNIHKVVFINTVN